MIDLPAYDPTCYLCPGNTRASGDANPQYKDTFVFVNDFSAVKESQDEYQPTDEPSSLAGTLLRAEAVRGKCYVLTFSAAHNVTLADMTPAQILPVVRTWTAIYAAHLSPTSPLARVARPTFIPPRGPDSDAAARRQQFTWMQIFENKGAAMGCSNPHPHGQIWTTTGMPEEAVLELANLKKYHADHGSAHMLVDYAQLERERGERVVFQNASFVVVCPWWAVWPFETMILPLRHVRALVDLTTTEGDDDGADEAGNGHGTVDEQMHLAECIAEVTRRYDNLFETSFPYSMGIHQAPLDSDADADVDCSSLHLHFYPPLLRSATVRKFLVGYELMSEPQRDITPEQAAARLRDCAGELYRSKLLRQSREKEK